MSPIRRQRGEVSAPAWRAGVWAARPMFALDADVTVYWPDVRPCWEESNA